MYFLFVSPNKFRLRNNYTKLANHSRCQKINVNQVINPEGLFKQSRLNFKTSRAKQAKAVKAMPQMYKANSSPPSFETGAKRPTSFLSVTRFPTSENQIKVKRVRVHRHSNKHTWRNTTKCNVRSKFRWVTDLQFTLRIAFRCVLHRCKSQEIHCWKLSFITKKNSKSQQNTKKWQFPFAPTRVFKIYKRPKTHESRTTRNPVHRKESTLKGLTPLKVPNS